VTTPPPIDYKGCEKKDKCFIVVPIWQGMITLSTITILMGIYALYHAFTILLLETTYAVVLLGMIIPNMIGDVYISMWLVKDNNNNRDNLISGCGLNLMGVIA